MKQITTLILSLLLITVNAQVAPQGGVPTRITHNWQQTPLSDVLHTISEESHDYHIH